MPEARPTVTRAWWSLVLVALGVLIASVSLCLIATAAPSSRALDSVPVVLAIGSFLIALVCLVVTGFAILGWAISSGHGILRVWVADGGYFVERSASLSAQPIDRNEYDYLSVLRNIWTPTAVVLILASTALLELNSNRSLLFTSESTAE